MLEGQQKPLELQSPIGQPLLPVTLPVVLLSYVEPTQAATKRPATRQAASPRPRGDVRRVRPWAGGTRDGDGTIAPKVYAPHKRKAAYPERDTPPSSGAWALLSLGGLAAAGVFLAELIHAAGGVHDLLLAGEERVAAGADFDMQVPA